MVRLSRVFTSLAAVVLVFPASLAAQPRVYAGATVAADTADRGAMTISSVPAAGVVVGVRFTDRWSIEGHLDRGFAEGEPHGQIGFFGTDTIEDEARQGFGVLAVWNVRPQSRVGLAVSMGLVERRFLTTRTVGIDRPVNLPPDDPLLQGQQRTTRVGGPTAGVLLPIALRGGWSIAPEVRVGLHFTSEGIYGDGITVPVYTGVRLMWGF